MRLFKVDFTERFHSHGLMGRTAKLLGIDEATLTNWTSPEKPGLPDLWDIARVAANRNVSPSWLAYGFGPEGQVEADRVQIIASAYAQSHASVQAAVLRIVLGLPDHFFPSDAAAVARQLGTAAPDASVIKPVLPPGTSIEAPAARDARKAREADETRQATKGAEDAPPYSVAPVEPRPRRVDRREEIPVFKVARRGRGKPVPHWLDLAAGPGRELERCKDYLYFRELHDWPGVHSARIKGDSMRESILPGDVVVLRAFEEARKLNRLEAGEAKGPLQVLSIDLPDGAVAVLQINGEEPTLKRLRYHVRKDDWHLEIVADNPDCEWRPRLITRDDEVVFWARLIGRAAAEGK